MRLLDTLTGRFVEKDPRTTTYAILSHTWDATEQTLQAVLKIQESYDGNGRLRSLLASIYRAIRYFPHLRFTTTVAAESPGCSTTSLPLRDSPSGRRKRLLTEPGVTYIWYDPDLSPKIRNASAFARKNDYRYLWIDSCCIDKTSSSELSESINSMFQWYAGSAVCYTFLADVPSSQDPSAPGARFRRSRWFTRGWTLQELIAPSELIFLSSDWEVIGSKHQLATLVEEVSGIDREVLLRQKSLNKFSVARRLSWAAQRETTRVEDRAYSLLGLFGLNMPTLYGEGEGALRRLQEEIMLRIPDQSLFAWRNVYALPAADSQGQVAEHFECHVYREEYDVSLLAPSLDVFNQEAKIRAVARDDVLRLLGLPRHLYHANEYAFSPYGIRLEIPVIPLSLYTPSISIQFNGDQNDLYLAVLGCETIDCPGHLLASFCHIPSSNSNVSFLYGGTVDVFRDNTLFNSLVRLFPLSPAALERCRPYIRVTTVYVTHRGRTTDALETARDWRHNDIRLVLPEEQEAALRAQGYTVDLRAPGHNRAENTHLLTVSKDARVIAVEYQHTLRRHGEELVIRARVTLSDSARAAEPAPVQPEPQGVAHWVDFRPWNVSLDDCTVVLTTGGAEVLTMKLGLDFAGPSCYRVRVTILGHHIVE